MTGNKLKYQLIKARDEYINTIKSEILGPGSEFSIPDAEHELISARPDSRYSVGILFPQGNQVNQDNEETLPVSSLDESTEDSVEQEDASDTSKEQLQGKNRQSHTYETDETANENLDEEIGMASQYMQSSMGITFLVKGDASHVFGNAKFATYRAASITDCVIPFFPTNPETYVLPPELAHKMIYDKKLQCIRLISQITMKEAREIFEHDTIPETEFFDLRKITYRFADYCRTGYVRVPHEIDSFELDFTKSDYAEDERNQNLDHTSAKIVALRTQMNNDIWSITVMLVNGMEESPVKPYHCIFQSKITISTQNNNFVFIESNPDADMDSMNEEEQSLALLYRHKKIYGTGLGTSVDWEIDDNGHGSIWSEFFPVREIPSMSFSLPENTHLTDRELSMKYLSDLSDVSKDQRLCSMAALVDLYKSWVDNISEIAKKLDPKYQAAATRNINDCQRAYERMYSGIETLKTNENAYTAFLLANRAMFMQRVHLKMQADMSNEDRYDDDEEIAKRLLGLNYCTESDNNTKWRPFQIAFLLMDIDSIVSDTSEDRSIVDLIWFPTGGGKTEAYLGLTAFTIFYRKLSCLQESGGTAVIMRYTLRLLAAQQFTRAATLICACEYIRQDSLSKKHKYPAYALGNEPITIGLWIGGAHIPNKNDDAKYHLDKLISVSKPYYVRNEKERHNKFQVLKCPWCGTKMVKDEKGAQLVGAWGYAMHGKHFYMHCPHEDCHFTNRLPIQIIDEELYETPPTLLFGTVDKFAMMPWDGRIGAFFSVGSNNRTPELIIQDELHLISGALGTMVGLYETAVDAMCSQKGIRPKVIASTATIRKAKEQCSVLYNRDVMQFPAPGIDAEDSFFAKEAPIDYARGAYGRKYIGIMPSGKTKAMTEIRMMAAMLQRTDMMDLPYVVKDKLWTLTVYFNSLRDLGKASTLVDDDVKDFIVRTANRFFTTRRLIIGADELTSRVSTTELNETLDKLEKVEYSEENRAAKRYASNILLATNMISVGIDVARLNVMLMIGQPKLTSEYIQASSRVGRNYPGVVFVQYDATKSRDCSHYERFRSYHESYYRFVEPTGATPFSKPARERALHAILTTMIRFKAGLIQDRDAGYFDSESYQDVVQDVGRYIINRIEEINNRASNGAKDDLTTVSREIQEFIEKWQSLVDECAAAEGHPSLYFGRKFMVKSPSSEEHRLLKQYNSSGHDPALNTLTSMRNVDTPVLGQVVVWEDN